MTPRCLCLLVALACAPGCVTYPVALLPDPPPEAAAWLTAPGGGAFLGLHTEENDSRSLDALFFEPGVRVRRVVENSPAARAGFRAGDVVLTLDGHELDDPETLDSMLRQHAGGDSVELSAKRGDTVFAVTAVLSGSARGDLPEPRSLYRTDPARSRAGWAPAPGGVRLVVAAEGSPFPAAGIVPGNLVTAVDGHEVLSPRSLIRRLQTHEPGEVVMVTVDGGRDVAVQLQDQPTRLTGLHIPVLFHYDADPDGSGATISVLDFWIFSVFRYTRAGAERTWELLEWIELSTGVGELTE